MGRRYDQGAYELKNIYICIVPKIAVYQALIFYIVSFDLSERLHLHVFSKQKFRRKVLKFGWMISRFLNQEIKKKGNYRLTKAIITK